MNRPFCPAHRAGAGFALLIVALLTSRAVQADTTYQIRAIARQGDTAGPVTIKPRADFEVGTLNDRGQLAFVTENAAGGEALLLYTDGQLLPIAYAGGEAPGGTWPTGTFAVWTGVGYIGMNQLGNIVFAPTANPRTPTTLGTFLWEYDTRKLTPIALNGQSGPNNLTLVDAGGGGSSVPVINNFGEIAFPAFVKNSAGMNQPGIFFLGRDGKLLPVALPDQEMPDGHKIVSAFAPQINDAGSVAFLAQREGEQTASAYLWDKGPITPLAAIGTDTPGGGKLAGVYNVWLNNASRSVVVVAPLKRNGPGGLYRIANGQVTPLVLPGQDLPDGRKLSTIDAVSPPNDAEQHAILASGPGGRAAYLLAPDGKLSLVLKTGTTTDLGTVSSLGTAGTTPGSAGIALNNRGQVSLPARITGGPAVILLLTPTAP
jgi:hypothetical protein